MIQALANGLQLRLELLVLYRESAVRILQQCLKILDALVAGKQLALCDPSLLLERRVLIDKLKKGFSIWSPSTCFSPNKADGHTHTCFCTSVSCSRLRSRNAIFFCCCLLFELRMTLLYCSFISSS